MGCVAIGWPPRSSAYKMNRTPFDGAPGTTAGSFASYWKVVAFHVYVVPNTTAGGKIVVANEKLWNGREVKLVPSAWTLAAVASGSAGFFGCSGLSPQAAASSAAATARYGRRER